MKARTRNAVVPLVLLSAVAAAVAYAYYGVERKAEQEKSRKEAEEKLFAFEPGQVKEITVEAKGSTTKLVRGASGWRIASPIEAEADRGAVDALLDKVTGLRRKQAIAASATGSADLARYGLEKPRARVTLALDGGKAETLALGDESGFDGSLFVRPTGGAVELAGGDAKWAIEKDLFELREKRLLVLEDKDVQRIEVTAPKLSYAVERAGTGWRLAAPLSDRADQTTVDRVVGALRGLRATQFVSSPSPDKAYGLDRPRYLVRLVGPGGAERKLAIGAAPQKKGEPDPATLYARVGTAREIAGVQAAQVKDLDEDLWALRDKSVLAFDRDKVAAVRFVSGDGTIDVQKKPAGDGGAEEWTLTSPRVAPARPWKISSILYGLSTLRATRFADEAGKALAAHGLDKPSQVVTLLGADGATLARLEGGRRQGLRAGGRPAHLRDRKVAGRRDPEDPRGPRGQARP
jgi:hypothetical protein